MDAVAELGFGQTDFGLPRKFGFDLTRKLKG
jgi:hypothetical protein